MISAIVYGRNDAHGYNLHKRAAISLNAMAQVLTSPDDEILFVDYNTPDDFPTFVEAIQDTLTDRAKACLRVLRVRPAIHRQFTHRAHLPVLEPIARNIALRRSNPANRWVLATNTDMIFVPRRRGDSLTTIAERLADGFYHLPRFELPETLWEGLDRRDAEAIIAQAEAWGRRFHLNDVVFGADTILFDAPGDFQLVLRDDLFAIDGFDEDMILGWHIDSNLAKRMTLLRGGIASALPHLFGYHCDHTRQADAIHGSDRVENDLRRFVAQVRDPALPHQRETWGQEGVEIEEVSLREPLSRRYIAALDRALTPMQASTYESHYTSEAYDDLAYVPEHVLPYVCDQLSSMPRGANLLFAGARGRFLDLLRETWPALGFTGRLLVPAELGWLEPSPAHPQVRHGPLASLIEEADLFLFEFGLASQDGGAAARPGPLTREDRDRLAIVREAFLDAVRREQERHGAGEELPRRFIAVNVINNEFEKLIQDTLSFTYTPFSSRTRAGFAVTEGAAAPPPRRADPRALRAWLKTSLGRSRIGPYQEVADLLGVLRELADLPPNAPVPAEAGALAAPLLALLAFPDLALVVPVGPDSLASLPGRIEAARASRRFAHGLQVAVGPDVAANGPRSGLPSIGDWEDPDWFGHARRHFGGPNAYSLFERSRWLWQRVSTLQALDQLGCLGRSARILVAVAVEEEFLGVLPNAVGTVHAIGAARRRDGTLRRAPDGLTPKGLFRSDRLAFLEGGEEVRDGAYDAVILPHGAALLDETIGIPGLLRDAERALRPGGVVAVMIDVALAPSSNLSHLPAEIGGRDGLRAWVVEHTALKAIGGFRDGLSPETFDRTDEGADPRLVLNSFVKVPEGVPTTEALWLFAKEGQTPPEGWEALGRRFQALALPEVWSRMRVAGKAERQDGAVVAPAGCCGLFLYGPLMRLLAGAYRLTVRARATDHGADDRPVLGVEIAAAEAGAVLRRDLTASALAAGDLAFDFRVPSAFGAGSGLGAHWEFRLSALGGTALAVSDVRLEPVPEAGSRRAPARAIPILPQMSLTGIARRQGAAVAVAPGQEAGCWLYGPYLPLPAGHYDLVFRCESLAGGGSGKPLLGVEIVAGDDRIGGLRDYAARDLQGPVRLPFTVSVPEEGFLSGPIECRFWYRGRGDLLLHEVAIEEAGAPQASHAAQEAPAPA